jgi:hypothetical protein
MTSIGLEHVGELKQCVGVYSLIPNGPYAGYLTDLGWRFYIDPIEHDVFALALNHDEQPDAERLLAALKTRSQAINPETFLQWCLGYANQFNLLGTLHAFADPTVVRNGALDPASQGISDALHERGM